MALTPGIIIPSNMQSESMRIAQDYRKFSDGVNGQKKLTFIGNGLAVDERGQVIVLPRQSLPTQTEAEDMVDRMNRFLEWEASEGINRSKPQPQQMRTNVTRASDPAIHPQPYYSPPDFANQFGIPVDQTEIIALCEEVSMYNALPEVVNGSNTESWREMTELNFTGGQNFIAFENGGCPEEYEDRTVNRTVAKKHIGAKKTISESDLVHSVASIAGGYGINQLIGAVPWQDVTGVEGPSSFTRGVITNAKEKEIRKQLILVLNGWDELLVAGSASANSEEFDGIETIVTSGNGARINYDKNVYTGTFSVTRFDEWLAAGCAKPTHVFGHPTAIQALKLAYWSLGAAASAPQVHVPGNSAIQAGATFANRIQTSVGELILVPDARFSRTDHGDGTFSSSLYVMRLSHNGEPLVYKATQIPLAFKDLAPGCSAISFMTWAVTALVVKHMCAHSQYRARFSGLADATNCTLVHPATNP